LTARDVGELLTLAALWGASFLLMRMGAGEFGPVALAAVRVGGAALVLLPLLALRRQFGDLRRHWRPIFAVGITNSALPFLCFSFAALSITAGLSAIFNAASPLFGAVIARVWLRDRLTPLRVLGLLIGFGGVAGLALSNAHGAASFKPGGSGWAVVACLAGSMLYGYSVNYTKRHLAGVAPMALAAGSQFSAALALAIPAWLWWPQRAPAPAAWVAAAMLAVASTGLAYVLYFRLIARIGPGNAIAVTFLIPLFAVLWGWLLLGEAISLPMLAGCAVILLGTGLATGLLKAPVRQ
jgi:drug/metabolite transporter (DMT)-like permease